jgi:hypothetical protein
MVYNKHRRRSEMDLKIQILDMAHVAYSGLIETNTVLGLSPSGDSSTKSNYRMW